jgi:uncharacterized membrane protein
MAEYYYSVEPIGPFPNVGEMTGPLYLNNAGVISGTLLTTQSHYHAVTIENGAITDLSPNASYAAGNGINDANPPQVAGRLDNQQATVWTGTTPTDIASLLGASSSEAKDINNNGVVTGTADGHAFTVNLNSNEVIKKLIPSADWSQAEAINNNGQVVGRGFLNFDEFWSSAFLCQPNTGTISLWKNGFFGDFAYDLNDNVTVVGKAKTVNDFYFPFRYGNNMLQLGGGANGSANGINAKGDIVGDIYSGNDQFASLYIDGQDPVIDLNERIEPGSGWLLQVAQKINNDGLIVGWGVYQNQPRPFLLRPLDKKPPWAYDFSGHLELIVKVIMFGGGGLGMFVPGGKRIYPKGPPVDPSGPFRMLTTAQRDVLIGLAMHILAGHITESQARKLAEKGSVDAIRVAVNQLGKAASSKTG